MSIQLIGKRLMINEAPLSFHRLSTPPPLAFYAKPYRNFANFCTEVAAPSTTPHRVVATDFFINKCGLTPEEIAKLFRHRSELLRAKSSQNMEEVLKLLNGCGLTTPAQIRRVIICNPGFLFQHAERNVQSKLIFFRTFMKEKDIARLFHNGANTFKSSERKLKAAVSLLQKYGIEGETLAEFLARQPRLLTVPEEKVIESFKQVEDLGFKKG
jgi:hypothetical protein